MKQIKLINDCFRHQSNSKMSAPIRVLVTGAAGQIGYSLVLQIAKVNIDDFVFLSPELDHDLDFDLSPLN